MESGICWSTQTGYIAHAISWHDIQLPARGNLRIWMHSHGRPNPAISTLKTSAVLGSETLFQLISLTIQSVGKNFPPVAKPEWEKFLELAMNSSVQDVKTLQGSLFRDFPFTQLEEDHQAAINACQAFLRREKNRRLKQAGATPNFLQFPGGKIRPVNAERKPNVEIDSSQATAIMIAKLYSEHSKLGTAKLVKYIAHEIGVSSDKIYSALRVARAHGWLTSQGQGRNGGELTAKGEKEFDTNLGTEHLNFWLRNR